MKQKFSSSFHGTPPQHPPVNPYAGMQQQQQQQQQQEIPQYNLPIPSPHRSMGPVRDFAKFQRDVQAAGAGMQPQQPNQQHHQQQKGGNRSPQISQVQIPVGGLVTGHGVLAPQQDSEEFMPWEKAVIYYYKMDRPEQERWVQGTIQIQQAKAPFAEGG